VVPVPLAVLVVLTVCTGFILKYTRLGRYAYAISSNLLSVSPLWQQVLMASVIEMAVAVDELRKRRRAS